MPATRTSPSSPALQACRTRGAHPMACQLPLQARKQAAEPCRGSHRLRTQMHAPLGLPGPTVCADKISKFGQFCIDSQLAHAFKGDVAKGLFFRGRGKLPFARDPLGPLNHRVPARRHPPDDSLIPGSAQARGAWRPCSCIVDTARAPGSGSNVEQLGSVHRLPADQVEDRSGKGDRGNTVHVRPPTIAWPQ